MCIYLLIFHTYICIYVYMSESAENNEQILHNLFVVVVFFSFYFIYVVMKKLINSKNNAVTSFFPPRCHAVKCAGFFSISWLKASLLTLTVVLVINWLLIILTFFSFNFEIRWNIEKEFFLPQELTFWLINKATSLKFNCQPPQLIDI